ncbi:hypothetical protein [Pectobacterium versatile]|uniref:hypothetical protein n=1 Tax=Pectobacterium versatile TaxID=2488639 RepID=UPI001F18F68B|nr:hypothetical protein [Pectobacterium versatile]
MNSTAWKREIYSLAMFNKRVKPIYLGDVVEQTVKLVGKSNAAILHSISSMFDPNRFISSISLDYMMIEVERIIGKDVFEQCMSENALLLRVEKKTVKSEVIDILFNDESKLILELIITRHRVMDFSETPHHLLEGNGNALSNNGIYITHHCCADKIIECSTDIKTRSMTIALIK